MIFCVPLMNERAHLKFGVVEPPIPAVLEKVRVAVAVAERVVDVVRDPVPVRDRLRVGPRDGRLLLGIEFPVFRALKKVAKLNLNKSVLFGLR